MPLLDLVLPLRGWNVVASLYSIPPLPDWSMVPGWEFRCLYSIRRCAAGVYFYCNIRAASLAK